MYYAFLADINKGVVTVLWGLNTLYIAFFDKIIYKKTVSLNHYIGLAALLMSALAISISYILEPEFISIDNKIL
jgi:fucose 4-O-acetylase-like acetyltransferase